MRLFIPDIGTAFQLTEDWAFNLHSEDRNLALSSAAGFRLYNEKGNRKTKEEFAKFGWEQTHERGYYTDYRKQVVLPMGSILTVDRIYIRRGAAEFSSISFNLNRKSVDAGFSKFARILNEDKGRCRFWAKLEDCNRIECNLLNIA